MADSETIIHTVTSPRSGETYTTPVNWDTLTEPVLILQSGAEISGEEVRSQLTAKSVPLASVAGEEVTAVRFKRRYVFFD